MCVFLFCFLCLQEPRPAVQDAVTRELARFPAHAGPRIGIQLHNTATVDCVANEAKSLCTTLSTIRTASSKERTECAYLIATDRSSGASQLASQLAPHVVMLHANDTTHSNGASRTAAQLHEDWLSHFVELHLLSKVSTQEFLCWSCYL